MIRSSLPIAHLAETPVRRSSTQTRVSGFDFAFLFASAAFIVVGCLFMLDLASSRSSGQESQGVQWFSETSVWLPAFAKACGKYALWLAFSVVNSALLTCIVQALRVTDRRLRFLSVRYLNSLSKNKAPVRRTQNVRGKREHLRREALKQREAQAAVYLLSPVFQ